jgi:hypothetical protein
LFSAVDTCPPQQYLDSVSCLSIASESCFRAALSYCLTRETTGYFGWGGVNSDLESASIWSVCCGLAIDVGFSGGGS